MIKDLKLYIGGDVAQTDILEAAMNNIDGVFILPLYGFYNVMNSLELLLM